MPLPLILGLGAVAAGIAGAGSAISGASKMKDANDTQKLAQKIHKENIDYFESKNKATTEVMDSLGKKELEILSSFGEFTSVFEKIHNKPQFKSYVHNDVTIPSYNPQDIRDVSVGAAVLFGGLGGAVVGTAGGFAAAGATTSAVMALGTASTGTAIASLSGAAATNATLAALGGGALGIGGGMALGSTILGATTLGVGLMVGGIIFNIAGSKLSDSADEALSQAKKEREQVNSIVEYLDELSQTAKKFEDSFTSIYQIYRKQLTMLSYIVDILQKRDWETFTEGEQAVTQNTVLLVNILYQMGKVELVLKAEDKNSCNKVNTADVNKSIHDAEVVLTNKGLMKAPVTIHWDEIKNILFQGKISEVEYYRWISDSTLHTQTADKIFLRFRSPDAARHVKLNYDNVIKQVLKDYTNRNLEVSYGYIEN